MIALATAGCHHGEVSHVPSEHSPYVGEEGREIKALSNDEVQGYLDGAGLGFAKVAELNGYPGPRHVLDLADSLALTAEQRVAVEESFRSMKREAQELGAQLVGTEKQLDRLFSDGQPTETAVRELSEVASLLTGRIRYTHLAAHLKMVEVLTPDQVATYTRLRGYGSMDHDGDHSKQDHDQGHDE